MMNVLTKYDDTKAFHLMLENQFECFDVLRKEMKSIKLASIQILNKLNQILNQMVLVLELLQIGVKDGAELFPTFGWPIDR